MATNSLSLDAILYLRQLLSFRVFSLDQYMFASRVRTAHATLHGIDLFWAELASTAIDCSRLNRLGSFQPPGWDTPAFVQNLRAALLFSGKPSSLVVFLESAVAKWLAKPKYSLQSLIMEAQLFNATSSDLYLRAWEKILRKRLPLLGYTENNSDLLLGFFSILALWRWTPRLL